MTDEPPAEPPPVAFAPFSRETAEQEEGSVLRPRFDGSGLVTAVVTDADSGELLMVAHMNADALDASLTTGVAHYWSRSRRALWKKGETSGAVQTIEEIRIDCDQDAVWLKVSVAKSKSEETCHTGRSTCFYRRISSLDERRLAFVEVDTEANS